MTIVRLTTQSDHWQWDQCAALYQAFMQEINLTPGNFYAWLTNHLADQNLCIFLALEETTAIGYTLVWNVPEHPHIPCTPPAGYCTHCYIVPDYRKQGVGKMLWQAVQEWFRQIGVRCVYCHAANDAARQYWEQRGFHAPVTRLKMEIMP